ncbi:DDE-type integrase/transposase/recombinase [Pseudosulfitobacter pseudonitzschiae]|uniref:DDE-type integrase/transposase/recombinase n=1 Tax=Pseudosulfitobacter pseudonitzschiae TaxID=1402135 RepID=UPI0021E22312|nr:DDE-type integrase/transposase/recombinase [Pseudosulfitobacter pseudonitzschiae]
MGEQVWPEITKRTEKHLRRASLDWHVGETHVRVGGKWPYLWRAVDANGLPLGTLLRNALPGSGWSTSV